MSDRSGKDRGSGGGEPGGHGEPAVRPAIGPTIGPAIGPAIGAAGPTDESAEALADELRALGRGMRIPDVDGETMAERVLAQLLAEAVPTPVPVSPGRAERLRLWARRRWRALVTALSGVLVVLVLTPPVRAAVVDWFDFGGVEVRYDPSASPAPSASVPGCSAPVSLAEAERSVGFRALVPTELGEPDAVSAMTEPDGRSVLSLCWRGGRGEVVRLDQFPAKLDFGFIKSSPELPDWVSMGSGTGVWFERPHLLRFELVDEEHGTWTKAERTAGPTLLWVTADERMTLRLEGVESLARAKEIAESTP
ncbi:hypothetical protein ACWEFL_12340 [Streptomyces sp. NPDC004838]